jgi:hypothetical protein
LTISCGCELCRESRVNSYLTHLQGSRL